MFKSESEPRQLLLHFFERCLLSVVECERFREKHLLRGVFCRERG